MKPTAHDKTISPATNRTRAGMTLIEVMIAAALMMVIVAGVMSAHFLGLRESQLLESKAGVNDTARRAVNQLLQDIRAAKGYDIGTMSGTNFTLITNGILQGAGLKLYSVVISTNQAVDPNKYLIYYFDSNQLASANGMLWRMNSTNGVPAVTVSNLINTLYFTSEDYFGRTQTVRTYKGVIHATLDFCQFQYPLVAVGSNGLYDTYRIDCRATPHLPDGP
jgi:type II secretory pathway pseudopilin PulG